MGDFKECLENIEEDPIYCTLNMIRVYMYLQEGVISSKLEAGKWGRSTFPKEMKNTIKKWSSVIRMIKIDITLRKVSLYC